MCIMCIWERNDVHGNARCACIGVAVVIWRGQGCRNCNGASVCAGEDARTQHKGGQALGRQRKHGGDMQNCISSGRCSSVIMPSWVEKALAAERTVELGVGGQGSASEAGQDSTHLQRMRHRAIVLKHLHLLPVSALALLPCHHLACGGKRGGGKRGVSHDMTFLAGTACMLKWRVLVWHCTPRFWASARFVLLPRPRAWCCSGLMQNPRPIIQPRTSLRVRASSFFCKSALPAIATSSVTSFCYQQCCSALGVFCSAVGGFRLFRTSAASVNSPSSYYKLNSITQFEKLRQSASGLQQKGGHPHLRHAQVLAGAARCKHLCLSLDTQKS